MPKPNVKITILHRLQNLIFPDYCQSCGQIGTVFCEYCKYDIVSERPDDCVVCRMPVFQDNLCGHCPVPYSRAWYVSTSRDSVEQLVWNYKIKRMRSVGRVFVSLLDDTLPALPDSVVVTAVPTVRSHVRQRGYDHAEVVARGLADARGLTYRPVLHRMSDARQRGATRAQRIAQAKRAFAPRDVEPVTYLLIDDVFTTGSTVKYAAKALRDGGAADVWVAIVARQPLEKSSNT